MALNPVVLVHGYSDQGASFRPWAEQLAAGGYKAPYHTCTYRSLVNHLTIKDIAEGFERAVTDKIGPDTEFDAIVHSTGMLVIRSWLIANPERLKRLKRLIGLAPATFGSPLAQPGRSFIGAIVRFWILRCSLRDGRFRPIALLCCDAQRTQSRGWLSSSLGKK